MTNHEDTQPVTIEVVVDLDYVLNRWEASIGDLMEHGSTHQEAVAELSARLQESIKNAMADPERRDDLIDILRRSAAERERGPLSGTN